MKKITDKTYNIYTWVFFFFDQLDVGGSDMDCDEATKCKLPKSIKEAKQKNCIFYFQ